MMIIGLLCGLLVVLIAGALAAGIASGQPGAAKDLAAMVATPVVVLLAFCVGCVMSRSR